MQQQLWKSFDEEIEGFYNDFSSIIEEEKTNDTSVFMADLKKKMEENLVYQKMEDKESNVVKTGMGKRNKKGKMLLTS